MMNAVWAPHMFVRSNLS